MMQINENNCVEEAVKRYEGTSTKLIYQLKKRIEEYNSKATNGECDQKESLT